MNHNHSNNNMNHSNHNHSNHNVNSGSNPCTDNLTDIEFLSSINVGGL